MELIIIFLNGFKTPVANVCEISTRINGKEFVNNWFVNVVGDVEINWMYMLSATEFGECSFVLNPSKDRRLQDCIVMTFIWYGRSRLLSMSKKDN